MNKISLIVAIDENLLIGNNNTIPWNVPSDLNLFKKITINNIVIMGRKTHESIGKLLPNRINIVVSKKLNPKLDFSNCNTFEDLDKILFVTSSLEEAIELSLKIQIPFKIKEIFVIGGGSIYKEALEKNLCSKLCISHILGRHVGDTYLEGLNFKNFTLIKTEFFKDFTYKEYFLKLPCHQGKGRNNG